MNYFFLVSEEKNNSVNAVEIGGLAAKFFCQAESVSPNSSPFHMVLYQAPLVAKWHLLQGLCL